jgi:hypothetical protein
MHRAVYAIPVFLLACSTSEFSPEETEAGLSSGPTVTIKSSLEGRTVSLYAVRFDEEGTITYLGSRIRHAAVSDGEAEITLPERAARRDRDPSKPSAPVSYVAFLHTTAEDGSPDSFVGVSREFISYYTGRDGSGKSGWYVVTVEEGEVDYARTDRVVSMDSSIAPVESVDIAGTRGALGPTAKVGLITAEGPVDAEYWGFTEEGTFKVSLSGEPAVTETYDDGSRFQVMNVVAFGDDDLDNAWGPEEELVGSVCYGLNSIFVEWREPASSPDQAWGMKMGGITTGWRAYARTEEGSFRLGGDMMLTAQESCTSMINTDYVEGEGE